MCLAFAVDVLTIFACNLFQHEVNGELVVATATDFKCSMPTCAYTSVTRKCYVQKMVRKWHFEFLIFKIGTCGNASTIAKVAWPS